MSNLCAVVGCDNRQRRNAFEDDGFTPLNFFRFKTTCPETLQAWLRVCSTDLTADNCKARLICSKHFLPSEILGNRFIRATLKSGAIPSRNIVYPTSFEIVEISEVATTSPIRNSTTCMLWCGDPPEAQVQDIVPPHHNMPHVVEFPIKSCYSIKRKSCHETHPIRNIQELLPYWHYETTNGLTWYFQVLISDKNSPELAKSVKVASDGSPPQFRIGKNLLSKKQCDIILGTLNYNNEDDFIVVLREFSKLAPPQVDRITSVLNTVSSMLKGKFVFFDDPNEENETCERDNYKFFLSFIAEQLKMYCTQPQSRKWNPSILTWALALHLNSPAAYRSISNSGYIILPTERTLRRYRSTDTKSSKPAEIHEAENLECC